MQIPGHGEVQGLRQRCYVSGNGAPELVEGTLAKGSETYRGLTSPLHRPRVIDFAQKYTAAVDFSDLDRARLILDRTHAFADPNEADAADIRLVLPMPEIVSDVQH